MIAWCPRAWIRAAIRRSLGSGSTVLFGGFMLGNAVAYAYQMLMSRALRPPDYGTLVTLTSVFYVLSVFWRAAQAWMIGAVAASGRGSSDSLRAVLLAAMRALLPIGVVAFVLLWVGSGWVATFLHLDSRKPVVLLGLYIFSSLLMPVAIGLPMGLNRPWLVSGILVLESGVRAVVGVALVALGLRVNGALAGFVAGNLASFVTTLAVLRARLSPRPTEAPQATPPKRYDPYALLVLVINVFLMTIASIDQVVVTHYFPGVVAGNYAVAFLLGRVITMATIALGWVTFARSVTLPPDDPRRMRVFVKTLVVSGAIAMLFTLAYLVAPRAAVSVLSGTQYRTANQYVGLEGIEMTLFSLAYVQAYYLISVRKVSVVWPLALASVLEVALLAHYHANIQQVLRILVLVMSGLLVWVTGLSWRTLRAAGARPSIPGPLTAAGAPDPG